jgi:O-antigen ligase
MTSVYAIILIAAIVLAQVLFGGGDGTRLIYVLPSYVLLGAAGILTVVSLRKAMEKARLEAGCLVSAVALSIYLFARMATSPVEALARVDFFILLASLLAYWVTAIFVTQTGHRLAIVIALLVAALAHVAIGVIQFAQDSYFLPTVTGGRGDGSTRASGLFISPNHLAGFLEIGFIIGLSLCLWSSFKATARVFIGYLTLACLAGIVLSGSRGGYLSVTAGTIALLLMSLWTARSRLSRRMLPFLLGIIGVVSCLGATLAMLTDRSFAIRARANAVFVSKDIRLQLWDAALRQFQRAPAFGTGSRTYLYYGRKFRAPEVQTDPVFAHNDYLQTLAEYGVVGIALFLAFIALHLRHGWARWSRIVERTARYRLSPADKNSLALQLGCFAALAAVLMHSVMDFNLHIPANALVVAMLFGMLATRHTRPDDPPARWWSWLQGAVPAALGAWMLAVGTPKVPGEFFVETTRARLVKGDPAGALREGERALEWGSRDPEVHYYIGEANRLLCARFQSPPAQAALLRGALKAYSDGLALFPQDVRLVLMSAWALQRLGQFDEASTFLARAAELDPNSGAVWAYHALHRKHSRKPAEALAFFEKAYNLGCNIPEVMKVLGEQLDPQALQKAAAALESSSPGAAK